MADKRKSAETPLMRQYAQIKAKHPDAVLLFRVGDFYETYGEDAVKASQILGIILTKRSPQEGSVELAGFPYHAIDSYLPKLVRAGERVAICEQLEDPKKTKTLVKRGIIELVTPGVVLNDHVLPVKENNFLAAVYHQKTLYGIAFLDVSTGEFLLSQGDRNEIGKLLADFAPKEILVERTERAAFAEEFGSRYYLSTMEDWAFQEDNAYEKLTQHFGTASLKGFGIHDLRAGITAAGAVLHYLDLTQHHQTSHINKLTRITSQDYVWIDNYSMRNLELLSTPHEGGFPLIDVLDQTCCPMGARLLRRWICMPLKDVRQIDARLDSVGYLLSDATCRQSVRQLLEQIGDLERIISKIAVRRITPRELIQLKTAMQATGHIRKTLEELPDLVDPLKELALQIDPCQELIDRIAHEIRDDAPPLVSKGNVIREGVNQELDMLRNLLQHSKEILSQMVQRESERTGIASLKIDFNNVFGYYIEVRNSQKDKVPEDWIRKQTLVNAERYITQELKEYESKILGAEERISAIEGELFNQLLDDLTRFIQPLQQDARLIARIDVLQSYAVCAHNNRYVRPVLNESDTIRITAGRHPVIEQHMTPGQAYVANDVLLDPQTQQILMITGPNMSGKSALLRQTALIVLMAQAGCYVPADAAEIGYVDRIFTRVGASDNLSAGESTFMVEMTESANILNNITPRSLVLLDEIGRGTSTYDGISIAWAMAEYLHEQPQCRAKTLFATHYHELNEMEKSFSRIRNYHITTKEINGKIIFLRKLEQGGSEHSFGIHVAELAGMPKSIVQRAGQILKQFELNNSKDVNTKPLHDLAGQRHGYQLSFFQLDDPVLSQIRDEIKNLDINRMTPLEALNKLQYISTLIGLK